MERLLNLWIFPCLQATSHPLLWNLLKTAATAGTVVAQAQLKRPALNFLRDHIVQGRTILPAAAMFEMAMALGKVNTPLSVLTQRVIYQRDCTMDVSVQWAHRWVDVWMQG